ncbi:hypothetical protein BLOT_007708 [Blomia tropicalis]|nr:hypothetical protein BLOT_007708 [Blomia tropicalis]
MFAFTSRRPPRMAQPTSLMTPFDFHLRQTANGGGDDDDKDDCEPTKLNMVMIATTIHKYTWKSSLETFAIGYDFVHYVMVQYDITNGNDFDLSVVPYCRFGLTLFRWHKPHSSQDKLCSLVGNFVCWLD